jgi:hypothetical protein
MPKLFINEYNAECNAECTFLGVTTDPPADGGAVVAMAVVGEAGFWIEVLGGELEGVEEGSGASAADQLSEG